MATQVRDVKTTTTTTTTVGKGGQVTTHVDRQVSNGGNPFSDRDVVHTHAPAFFRCLEAPSTYHRVTVDAYDKYFEPAIFEHGPFNPEEDAKAIRKALKEKGTDEKSIINILTRRSNRQRQIIAYEYQKIHGRDLAKDLKSDLSGTLEDVLLGLLSPPEVFDARTLNKAVAGLGTDEQTLIEVIGSRSAEELAAIKKAYRAEFKNELEKDIAGDTSGFFRQLLLARIHSAEKVAQQGRSYEIYPKRAFHEAQALWETGPKKWQNNESFFIPIFTERSDEHLRQVFEDYKAIGRIDIEKDIEKELSGDAKDLLLAFVRVSKNRPAYFANRLHQHLDGKTCTRIIVSRSEKDLGSIRKEYARLYGKSLDTAISEGFKGDAKQVLLGVLTSRSASI
ncbi:Annexin A3 [Hypsibius exemplaris]|uniref:Annexin n=1 Tax=Hypsibius exemplaris TaxID=2072580 RepID=A0A1W0XD98_HYPEX|nr:Annexin A3 [Hypsibius exemplaris]